MSKSARLDLSYINSEKIPDEKNPVIESHTILYPIAKAFLETYPQYYNIIRTYENSVESIADIVSHDKVLDEFISIDDNTSAHFRCWIDNVRIYSPDSIEAAKYSNFGYIPTPNHALSCKGLYSAVIIGDFNYSWEYIYKRNSYDSYMDLVKSLNAIKLGSDATHEKIENGFVVNMPIPIGCKWCSLNNFDKTTLIKSAEEITSMYGYFIIDGFFRYIVSIYKAPFNKPIIVKNNFDDQLSRTEVLYTKGYEYENSYHIVGALVTPKNVHVGRGGSSPSPPDIGFSLQMNHPLMIAETVFGGKHTHKLYNFVPIKFLFGAFGCTTDEELIEYICPDMNDFGLINTIRQACLTGYKHREAVRIASIKTKSAPYLAYEEPLTEFMCKYIIGCIILKETIKNDLLTKCNRNEEEYRLLVAQAVTMVFNETFMPGIGDNSKVDRNTAVCVELGLIVKQLYLIGYGLEASQDKTSLTNRRIRIGQQMSREFKAFHGVRLREILSEVTQIFTTSKNREMTRDAIINKMQILAKNISVDQSRSLINAFKGTSKEQSKLRTDLIVCKNQAFVWNKLNEIVISSDTSKQTGATVTWEHRTVHQSELFFICPTQTPESGKETGRYKTPTLYTYVTIATKGYKLLEIVQKHPKYQISTKSSKFPGSLYVVRLNGSTIGYIEQYEPVNELYRQLMKARQTGEAEFDATIILNHTIGYLDIWTDTGRIVSPFVIVKNCFNLDYVENEDLLLKGSITIKKEFREWLRECSFDIDHFHEGVRKGFIEFMDPEMAITNAVIAPSIKEFYDKPVSYTHVALPSHTHGIIASIPAAMNMNTGVRCSYLTNHVKQAIGPVLRYPQLKYLGENNILVSPQIPIVRPCAYNFMHLNETPFGANVIVAFIQFKYNQEDSIIMNRTSVEQGLLRIDSLVTKEYKIDKNDEEFKIPDPNTVLNGNPESYNKLDPNTALPRRIGEVFWEKDALIAKVTKTTEGENDNSILNDKPDGKYPPSANPRPVRCVVKNRIHGNNRVMKKQVYGQYRCPLVGDKFNSEHAQKGTCGKIMDPEDLPYTKTGIRPDIIFNPPTIFKRKTYGQIYMAIMSKLAALLGCQIDCTPYHTTRSDEEIIAILEQMGLQDAGYETMYDGETNRPYKARIFVGMHYWERQSHLVEQKLNVRNGGQRVVETGQPMKGKKHHGGQSADRMTYDCHVAAGINEIIRDLHLNCGSKMKVGICKRCHTTMGYFNQERKEWVCPRCGSHPDFIIREMPPASVLMIHIMNGLHISVDYFDCLNEIMNDRCYDTREIEYERNEGK